MTRGRRPESSVWRNSASGRCHCSPNSGCVALCWSTVRQSTGTRRLPSPSDASLSSARARGTSLAGTEARFSMNCTFIPNASAGTRGSAAIAPGGAGGNARSDGNDHPKPDAPPHRSTVAHRRGLLQALHVLRDRNRRWASECTSSSACVYAVRASSTRSSRAQQLGVPRVEVVVFVESSRVESSRSGIASAVETSPASAQRRGLVELHDRRARDARALRTAPRPAASRARPRYAGQPAPPGARTVRARRHFPSSASFTCASCALTPTGASPIRTGSWQMWRSTST